VARNYNTSNASTGSQQYGTSRRIYKYRIFKKFYETRGGVRGGPKIHRGLGGYGTPTTLTSHGSARLPQVPQVDAEGSGPQDSPARPLPPLYEIVRPKPILAAETINFLRFIGYGSRYAAGVVQYLKCDKRAIATRGAMGTRA